MSDAGPYLEARREWNDRYLDLVRERRAWQAVAGAELVLTLVLAGGLVWVGRQHKTVPYVVEVDSLGAALAIKPADPGGHPADERIVRYQLAAFIRGARQVMADRIAMKKELGRVYAYARGGADRRHRRDNAGGECRDAQHRAARHRRALPGIPGAPRGRVGHQDPDPRGARAP
jgi:type IV secretory pathway TrbF-like protein